MVKVPDPAKTHVSKAKPTPVVTESVTGVCSENFCVTVDYAPRRTASSCLRKFRTKKK